MGLLASSIIPLLSKWEEYLGAFPDGDMEGFAHWLLATQPAAVTPSDTGDRATGDRATGDRATAAPAPDTTQPFPLLIARLHRMLEFLSKPLAKELGLSNSLEFDLLIRIAVLDRPNKKQLCQELFVEGSTGVEITKRLAAKGLILEKPDPEDRRSARLSLTEKGKQLLLQGYTKLETIHSDFFGSLRPQEKEQLSVLLARLNTHHASQIPLLS
jgi:DNA-binding MarR family transcriptional regulator